MLLMIHNKVLLSLFSPFANSSETPIRPSPVFKPRFINHVKKKPLSVVCSCSYSFSLPSWIYAHREKSSASTIASSPPPGAISPSVVGAAEVTEDR